MNIYSHCFRKLRWQIISSHVSSHVRENALSL